MKPWLGHSDKLPDATQKCQTLLTRSQCPFDQGPCVVVVSQRQLANSSSKALKGWRPSLLGSLFIMLLLNCSVLAIRPMAKAERAPACWRIACADAKSSVAPRATTGALQGTGACTQNPQKQHFITCILIHSLSHLLFFKFPSV